MGLCVLIVAAGLRYESGEPMPPAVVTEQIALVRAVEVEVQVWWDWWKGWEYLAAGNGVGKEVRDLRADAVQELNPCRPGAQGTLF